MDWKVISGTRGIGKTKLFLEQIEDKDAVIVAANPDELRRRAYGYGITGLNIISIIEYLDMPNTYANNPVYIYNIKEFINTVTNGNLRCYTETVW